MPVSHHAWIIEVMYAGDMFEATRASTLQAAIGAYQQVAPAMPYTHKAQIALVCTGNRASVTDIGEFISDAGFVPPVRFQRELQRHASAVFAADI